MTDPTSKHETTRHPPVADTIACIKSATVRGQLVARACAGEDLATLGPAARSALAQERAMAPDPQTTATSFDPAAFGARLTQALARRMLSFRAGARAVGVSPATLNRVSRGGRPDLDTLTRISQWIEKEDR